MNNILIIKHGSLGDVIQCMGVIEDIKNHHLNDKIYILTTQPFVELFKQNKNIDEIIIDNREKFYNIIKLYDLMNNLLNKDFKFIYDLQNSSRTNTYRIIMSLFSCFKIWSSSKTLVFENNETLDDFNKKPILDRFAYQLKMANIKVNKTFDFDLNWMNSNINLINKKYNLDKYIVISPFASKKEKEWPYYKELIQELKKIYANKYQIVIAPGPNEIKQSKELDAITILNNNDSFINIRDVSTLIKNCVFYIGNDSGLAHIAYHQNCNGLILVGSFHPIQRVSLNKKNLSIIQVKELTNLTVQRVVNKIINSI